MQLKVDTWTRLALVAILFLFSCNKDDTRLDALRNDTIALVNDEIYANMKKDYLWFDSIPSANPVTHKSPMHFISTIENWRDHWSFVFNNEEYQSNFVTGEYYGYGFSYGFDNENKLRIVYVFKSSPLYSAGVKRGWIIKSINGIIPDTSNIKIIWGTESRSNDIFKFTRSDGNDTTLSISKTTITQNTVLAYDTFHINNKVVGYISFLEFDLTADKELDEAFGYFKANAVTDLVLDLRYNGGGQLDITLNLANKIVKNQNGKIFVTIAFNKNNSENNQSIPFQDITNSLNLSRLFVITTNETASASEALINGIKGVDIPVYLIGSRTHGKPVGMLQHKLQLGYYLYAINFKLVNAKGFGEYYGGLPVDKPEIDDLSHDFGDRNEACLDEALYFIQNGSFKVESKALMSTKIQPKVYFEKRPVDYLLLETK